MKIDIGETEKRAMSIFLSFVLRIKRWLVLILAIALLAYCGYLWNKYIYNFKWSEAKKQEYIKQKENGVIFDKAKFEKVAGEIEERDKESQKSLTGLRDIFKVQK